MLMHVPTSLPPLQLARLSALMARSSGSPEVKVGLIDGPVAMAHSDLASNHILGIPGSRGARGTETSSPACLHGTFVAGILSAKRSAPAPAISPGCTLLIRPVFVEQTAGTDQIKCSDYRNLVGIMSVQNHRVAFRPMRGGVQMLQSQTLEAGTLTAPTRPTLGIV